MQTVHCTPAECLLRRLLDSEKVEINYQITVQKEENYTCISLAQKGLETSAGKAEVHSGIPF
jgi:hypothetical protein